MEHFSQQIYLCFDPYRSLKTHRYIYNEQRTNDDVLFLLIVDILVFAFGTEGVFEWKEEVKNENCQENGGIKIKIIA